jgi:hypothetical protein
MDDLNVGRFLLNMLASLIVLNYYLFRTWYAMHRWRKATRNGLAQKLHSVQLPSGWEYKAIVVPPAVNETRENWWQSNNYLVEGKLNFNRDKTWQVILTYPHQLPSGQNNVTVLSNNETLFVLSSPDKDTFPQLLKAMEDAGFVTIVVSR